MRTVYIDDSTQGVKLGFRQEHDYTEIVYTLPSDWNGVVEAFIKKPGATASVPLTGVTQTDGTVSLTLTRTDLIEAGRGALEYMCTMNGVVAKSKVFSVIIAADIISESTDRPDEWESWIDELTALAAQVRTDALSAAASATSASGSASSASQSASGAAQSAQSAGESAESASKSAQSASDSAADAEEAKNTILGMTATATTLPEGSSATVDYSNGVMAFGIPRGDKGAKGDKGAIGEIGATPQMSIGTVETLAPDEDATATITGTAENPVLNLGLPKGETGDVSKAELASLMPLETVSGSVASFSDGSAVFDAESVLITLEPIQSGSGTPSPDNVRPISGRDSVKTIVSPTTSASDGTTYTTDLERTVYGGTVDLVSGVLTVDRVKRVLDGSEVGWQLNVNSSNPLRTYGYNRNASAMGEMLTTSAIMSDSIPSQVFSGSDEVVGIYVDSGYLWIRTPPMQSMTETADWLTYLAQNPLEVVYRLTTPQTYQLTPQAIALLTGDNNIWSEDGSIEVKYRANIGLYVDKKISEVSQ